jgi:hypothetical protein
MSSEKTKRYKDGHNFEPRVWKSTANDDEGWTMGKEVCVKDSLTGLVSTWSKAFCKPSPGPSGRSTISKGHGRIVLDADFEHVVLYYDAVPATAYPWK